MLFINCSFRTPYDVAVGKSRCFFRSNIRSSNKLRRRIREYLGNKFRTLFACTSSGKYNEEWDFDVRNQGLPILSSSPSKVNCPRSGRLGLTPFPHSSLRGNCSKFNAVLYLYNFDRY